MSENRYSMMTAGKYLSLTTSAVQYRARKLKIDTRNGLTADDVKKICEFEKTYIPEKPRRNSLEQLKAEMEGLYHE